MRRFLSLLLLSSLLVFPSCAKKEREALPSLLLRYADNQPENFPTTLAAEYFASLVEERTDGKIQIVVYDNGELGGEVDVLSQIQFGGIDFSRFSLGTLDSFYPELSVLQLPYLYRDGEHMWRVLDGEIGEEFLSGVSRYGAIGLCWFDAGVRSFYTRRPIQKMEDIRGMRIRTQESQLMESIISLLGATAIQMPYGSVYSALKMNQIDGAENNFPSYVFTGHFEAAPYFFQDEHFRLPEMMIMSTAARAKIEEVDPSFFPLIVKCAREASLYERKLWAGEEERSEKEAREAGCVITRPDEEEKRRWKEAMEPIYDEFSDDARALIERIRTQ